ncbi:Hypothetical_protein [Hexamita inflata]|uniref:Hypothetical_protein n=1 Tax=Hexamita inflata TaxID=28002 RepID=A0AA86TSU9_9EUKA|nr:Hypothetical protein HINF_LOCUS13127 [Hexamita inflata]
MMLFVFFSKHIQLNMYFKQVQYQKNDQLCNNQLKVNANNIIYCEKSVQLQSQTVSTQLTYSKKENIHMTLYSSMLQNNIIKLSFGSHYHPQFSLFGLTQQIMIQNSVITVNIPQNVSAGSLICFQCMFSASSSEFSVIISGVNVSGLVYSAISNLILENCLVQFRLTAECIGGLISNVYETLDIQIVDSNLTGYLVGEVKGVIICDVEYQVAITFLNTKMCSNLEQFIGAGENLAQTDGQLLQACDVCQNGFYSYGICALSLNNAETTDNKLICKLTFEFDGQQCACPEGAVLNGSVCIYIINKISQILIQLKDFEMQVEQYLSSNTTEVNQNLLQLQSDMDSRIISNMSALEAKIQDSADILDQSTQDITQSALKQLSNTALTNSTITELQQMIVNLKTILACRKQQGYSFVENECMQVLCTIPGQMVIRGICQCMNVFETVVNDQCQCPENAVLADGICVCAAEYVMRNGECVQK